MEVSKNIEILLLNFSDNDVVILNVVVK